MSDEQQTGEIQIERLIAVLERGVAAFESIAVSFSGINVSMQKIQRRYAPDPRRPEDVREAVVSRVPTPEDIAKEAQGASDKPIGEWLNLDDVEEEIGPREKEFLERQQRAEAIKENRQGRRRTETPRGERS